MKKMLRDNYAIDVYGEQDYDGKTGFLSNNCVYFTIPIQYKKEIYMEQAVLAHYLMNNGVKHMAYPIPNTSGEWLTSFHDEQILVLKVDHFNDERQSNHGKHLAQFHAKMLDYDYHPQNISSYGQWQSLWTNKLETFEQMIQEKAEEHPHDFYRLLMDHLPYLIGMSENAIQYIQETTFEFRYHRGDQSTITFYRYENQIMKPVIWMDDIVHDHPARDIAEFIRNQFLSRNQGRMNVIETFLDDYTSILDLSPFAWRSIYARLLFPVHLFDLIQKAWDHAHLDLYVPTLAKILQQQTLYERQIDALFSNRLSTIDVPRIKWLSEK